MCTTFSLGGIFFFLIYVYLEDNRFTGLCCFLPYIGMDQPPVHFSRSVVSESLRSVDRSTPGLPVHHQLLEVTQTHVHRVDDAVRPSHPLSSPSAPSPSQHQGLFQGVSSSHQVAKGPDRQLEPYYAYVPSLAPPPPARASQNPGLSSQCSGAAAHCFTMRVCVCPRCALHSSRLCLPRWSAGLFSAEQLYSRPASGFLSTGFLDSLFMR